MFRRWMLVLSVFLFVGRSAEAGPVDDLARLTSDYSALKSEFDQMDKTVESFVGKSRKLREMDEEELDQLISQICRQDVARDDDEADRLIKSLSAKSQEKATAAFDTVQSEGEDLLYKIAQLVDRQKTALSNTEPYRSIDEVKSDASALYSQQESTRDYTSKLYDKVEADLKSMENVKEGVMNGSNNPRIRAAMEYGKEKHEYNQKICQEKEISLSSGRPDCITFVKDNCAVWEFKPDTYSESDARRQAQDYVPDVQRYFKDQQIAIDNCLKDSNGLPIFEAKGVLYPACRS